MKRLLCFAVSVLLCLGVFAQIEVGLRNTRFAYCGYTLKNRFNFRVVHSIFAEKIAFQNIQLQAYYRNNLKWFDYLAGAYGSSTWNGDWKTAGAKVGIRWNAPAIVHISAVLNPHYDTGYGYSTNFSVGTSFDISKSISTLISYTTIPDYRKSEKRIHGGFEFHVERLSVSPVLSIPVDERERFKQIRILVSFNYKFR